MPRRAPYHEELAKAMSRFHGQTLLTADIKKYFAREYPSLADDVEWVQPTDHCVNHECIDDCWCAKTELAIFRYLRHKTFLVL